MHRIGKKQKIDFDQEDIYEEDSLLLFLTKNLLLKFPNLNKSKLKGVLEDILEEHVIDQDIKSDDNWKIGLNSKEIKNASFTLKEQ